jgi:hypothetical protein
MWGQTWDYKFYKNNLKNSNQILRGPQYSYYLSLHFDDFPCLTNFVKGIVEDLFQLACLLGG